MNRAVALLLAALGVALLGFGVHVGRFGAEPSLPEPSACIEGELLEGTSVAGPVGDPFLYGELRLHDADNADTRFGTVHYRAVHGATRQRVRTAEGIRDVTLPAPGRWRIVDGSEESRTVASLDRVPLLAGVDVGERLSPPFRVSARVVRAGDHVIVPTESSRVPLYVGARDALEAQRRARERGRFPMVGILVFMGCVSLYGARRALAGSLFAASDEGGEAT